MTVNIFLGTNPPVEYKSLENSLQIEALCHHFGLRLRHQPWWSEQNEADYITESAKAAATGLEAKIVQIDFLH